MQPNQTAKPYSSPNLYIAEAPRTPVVSKVKTKIPTNILANSITRSIQMSPPRPEKPQPSPDKTKLKRRVNSQLFTEDQTTTLMQSSKRVLTEEKMEGVMKDVWEVIDSVNSSSLPEIDTEEISFPDLLLCYLVPRKIKEGISSKYTLYDCPNFRDAIFEELTKRSPRHLVWMINFHPQQFRILVDCLKIPSEVYDRRDQAINLGKALMVDVFTKEEVWCKSASMAFAIELMNFFNLDFKLIFSNIQTLLSKDPTDLASRDEAKKIVEILSTQAAIPENSVIHQNLNSNIQELIEHFNLLEN